MHEALSAGAPIFLRACIWCKTPSERMRITPGNNINTLRRARTFVCLRALAEIAKIRSEDEAEHEADEMVSILASPITSSFYYALI